MPQTPPQKKRFVIYTRCSTDDQGIGEFTTLDVQASYCRNILEAKGYEAADIIKDDGYSGKDLDRPGIQSILSNIGIDNQERKFEGIIFHRLDRLSRNPRDIYKLIDIFDKYKIEFISVQESLDASTPMGRMMIGMFAIMAEFERNLISDRVKTSALARVRQGKYVGSLLPYGYKRIDDGPPLPNGRQFHKIVPDEKITPKLKRVWEKVIENKSLRTIAKELEDIGLKSYAGKPWRVQSLQIIVRNPFYKGILRYNGEQHKGEHKAIVSSEIWDRANQIIGSRLPMHRFTAKPKPYIYLLEGLLKCGHCGSALVTYHAVGRSGEKFPYYVCSRKHQNLGCNSTLIPAAKFDRDFVSYLKDCSRDPKIISRALKDAVSETQNQLNHLSKNLHKIEKQLAEKKDEADHLLDLILKGAAPKGPTVKDRLAKTEAESAVLQEKLDKLLAAKKVTEISADSQNFINTNLIFLTEMFDKIAPEAQKTMLQLLIKEIQLHDDRIRLTMAIGRAIENNIPPGLLPDDVKKKKRSLKNQETLPHADDGSYQHPNKLPELDARRTSQLHIVHMVVRIYTRRSRKQLIRFGDPLPEKPIRAKRIIQNTIYEGLKIQAFINNGPGRITWAKARKELNISEAKLAHLLKIVNTLPPDFVKNMETCNDENMLKIFNGRRLLKISRLKTEKERRAEIERLLPKS